MKIIIYATSMYGANCYLVFSEANKVGFIVDPGGDALKILDLVDEYDLDIKSIILTHGHGDHIGAVEEIRKALDIPVIAHEDEVELLADPRLNHSSSMSYGPISLKADKLVKDGEKVEYGDLKVEFIHTPGHTRGGMCIVIGDVIISGDTLFQGSIGRTDFPGGDFNTIISSIKNKILVYPDDYKVLPGHGMGTTVLEEKTRNPFLK